MQSLRRKRTKNDGCQVIHYLNCPVLPYYSIQNKTKKSRSTEVMTERVLRSHTKPVKWGKKGALKAILLELLQKKHYSYHKVHQRENKNFIPENSDEPGPETHGIYYSLTTLIQTYNVNESFLCSDNMIHELMVNLNKDMDSLSTPLSRRPTWQERQKTIA